MSPWSCVRGGCYHHGRRRRRRWRRKLKMHVFHAKEPVAETNSEAAPSSLPHELT
jgi:hypothetical protein